MLPIAIVIAEEIENAGKLQGRLSALGLTCSLASFEDKASERITRELPDLIVLEMNGQAPAIIRELVQGIRVKLRAPILAVITEETLSQPEDYAEVDDFIIQPFADRELAFRVRRLLQKNARKGEIIRCGDLMIDLDTCEVRVAGKIIELTFKEYELLKFLIKDRGRVFTRETLLNKVWGYDYFGGDRTVDVHVRRLRSKIESADHVFIETVRNIGYRFKKEK
jgi:DNA-binding response OmpR family regulator